MILLTFVYTGGYHPNFGHIHVVLHSDGTVIEEQHWEECLKRAPNYANVTEKTYGSLNIKNQSNFGVQTPGPVIYNLPLDQKPGMLIMPSGLGRQSTRGWSWARQTTPGLEPCSWLPHCCVPPPPLYDPLRCHPGLLLWRSRPQCCRHHPRLWCRLTRCSPPPPLPLVPKAASPSRTSTASWL